MKVNEFLYRRVDLEDAVSACLLAAKRASAIGFVYAGTGLGIMLLAPLSEWLISSYGWARAFEIYAAIVFIGLLPVVWLFYQHGPHGEHLRHRAEKKDDHNQWTARLALQSLQFWLLFIARIAAASGTTVIVTHQVAHVVDVGAGRAHGVERVDSDVNAVPQRSQGSRGQEEAKGGCSSRRCRCFSHARRLSAGTAANIHHVVELRGWGVVDFRGRLRPPSRGLRGT